MHLTLPFPERFAPGAIRDVDYDVEIVTTDDGGEVRNNRWDAPMREWEIPFPNVKADSEDFAALKALWKAAEGQTHSFLFYDEIDEEQVPVRFAAPLRIISTAGPWVKAEAIMLKEVRL